MFFDKWMLLIFSSFAYVIWASAKTGETYKNVNIFFCFTQVEIPKQLILKQLQAGHIEPSTSP